MECWIGDPVIRGIQFAVGLVLLETGVRIGLEDPLFGVAGLAIAGLAVVVGRREAGELASPPQTPSAIRRATRSRSSRIRSTSVAIDASTGWSGPSIGA